MTTFDLGALLDAALDGPASDPADVWAEVVAGIPSKELRGVLLEVGAHWCSARIAVRRNNAIDVHDDEDEVSVKPRPGSSKWANVQRVRNLLDQRVATADGWKRIGEMTADDCLYAASIREAMAAGNLARADLYRSFAKACEEHGAETVAALPPSIIKELLP